MRSRSEAELELARLGKREKSVNTSSIMQRSSGKKTLIHSLIHSNTHTHSLYSTRTFLLARLNSSRLSRIFHRRCCISNAHYMHCHPLANHPTPGNEPVTDVTHIRKEKKTLFFSEAAASEIAMRCVDTVSSSCVAYTSSSRRPFTVCRLALALERRDGRFGRLGRLDAHGERID